METVIYLIVAIFLILLAIPFAIIIIINKNNSAQQKLNNSIIDCCSKANSPNEAIGKIFKLISSIVLVNEYSFYIFNNKNNQFNLKSIRYKNEAEDKLGMTYSGMSMTKTKKYYFPNTIMQEDAKNKITVTDVDEKKVISIPVLGGKAYIQLLANADFKIKSSSFKKLEEISKRLETVVALIFEYEGLNNKINILETSKQATRSIAGLMNGEGIYSMAIGIFTKTIGAVGGFFIHSNANGMELSVCNGFTKDNTLLFKYDVQAYQYFKEIVADKKLVVLSKKDEKFQNLPVYFSTNGVKQLILLNMEYGTEKGIAGFWYDHMYEIDEYQVSSILLMFSKIVDVFDDCLQITCQTKDNVKTLKTMSTLVDNLSPFTVGFSNMMEFYASIIADKLKLSEQEKHDVALAAFLSNIGIAALSYDVFLAKGKYSDFDYEVIKLHSDVGADIIEAMYNDTKVANMVRYHHERIDGRGYPYGLKGDEIPIGAKILAVAQFFVAKISPRNYRETCTFDETLEAMKQVANTQLDANVVNAFISLITEERLENRGNDCSLDYCYKMRFVPDNICFKCPAKYKADKRCWEVQGVLCMAHGDKCENCAVYTEYMGRKSLAKE